MKSTQDFWKIFNTDKSVMILTACPDEFENGDGVYFLMKRLQPIFGADLCSTQKFDERFDKIEDFDTILCTDFNLWNNRLISAHLYEYDKKGNTLTVDRAKTFRVETVREYTYRISKTRISAIDGFCGLRSFICGTMDKDSAWVMWGNPQFGDGFFRQHFKNEQ